MRAIVESRCAIAITVLPCIRSSSCSWIASSTSLSSAERRLVEHEDRRVLQDHARERDALPLAARELHAALADVGVVAGAAVPVAQAHDELVRLRLARGRDDLAPRSRSAGRSGCWPRSSDAAATCPASPCRSRRAGSPASTLRDVLAVDRDPARLGVVQAAAAGSRASTCRRPSGRRGRRARPAGSSEFRFCTTGAASLRP